MQSRELEPCKHKPSSVIAPSESRPEQKGDRPTSRAVQCSRAITNGVGIIRIREARKQMALSLGELAKAIEISPSYLSKIETGKAIPPLRVLERIAYSLDIDVTELLRDDGIEAGLKHTLPLVIPEITEESVRLLVGVSPSLKRDLLRVIDSLISAAEGQPTAAEAGEARPKPEVG